MQKNFSMGMPKLRALNSDMSHRTSNMQADNDINCMTEVPLKNKCSTELLLDYRFTDTLFHTISYDPEWQVINFGSSKGQILSYYIKIGSEKLNDMSGSYISQLNIVEIVNDSALSKNEDTIVFQKEFE